MNTEPFKLKEKCLDDIVSKQYVCRDETFELSCNYHGIDLNFHCKDKRVLADIKNHIPDSWINSTIVGQKVLLISPRDFNISEQDFANEESQDCFNLDDGARVIQRDFAARVSEDIIYLICELKVCDGLFNFLRWFLPRKLIEKKSFILHSSCVLDKNNRAHFFLGHSGAGKTTLSSLSSPRKILGDDMNIITIENGKVLARAGAIGGAMKPEVDYDSSFEVASFNWIVQSTDNSRKLLNKSAGKLKIIASITNIFWDLMPDKDINFLLESVSYLNKKLPVYELSFQKNSSFWSLIES